MDKKYLKKVVTGLSIAGLVTGIGGLAIGAGGWSGGQKSAGSAQEVKQEAPTPAPGYGKPVAAPGYGKPVAAPTAEEAAKAEEEKAEEAGQEEEKKAE
jgi:radical SAM modification target selenobiotic family peptide